MYGSEPVYVNDERTVRARKEHICDACNGRIGPGHYYVRHFMRWSEGVETIKRCGRCETLYQYLVQHLRDRDEYPDQRLDCGDTWEEVNDGEPPPPELVALAFATDDEAGALLRPGTREGGE
jgi:predicted RNA-binding Zn-ribbon protein involved in translation (DUF1610 family)